MRLWLPKVRVHESETRRRNIRLSGKGENKPSGNYGELLEKGGSRHGGGRENKRPGCRREPENVHAPFLNSKNNSSEIPTPVQGATTCPSTYVRCSE